MLKNLKKRQDIKPCHAKMKKNNELYYLIMRRLFFKGGGFFFVLFCSYVSLFFAHLNIVINWILYDLLGLEVVASNVS